MSDKLVFLARTAKFGERFASRKLAMIGLCNGANDQGDGVDAGIDDIKATAECSERTAWTIRKEFEQKGLLTRVYDGGNGAGDRAIYRINVNILEALANNTLGYHVLGGHNRPATVAPLFDEDRPATKDATKPATGRTSSISKSSVYSIDDLQPGLPLVEVPEWAIEEVQKLEPQRWEILLEAFLRWKGSAKAIDPGRAFVGWAKRILGISKPLGNGKADRADWAMIFGMIGTTAEKVARGQCKLPSAAALKARRERTRAADHVPEVPPDA